MEVSTIAWYINQGIGLILVLCLFYQIVYVPLGFLLKNKQKRSKELRRYAVLIAARNEEKVLPFLLDSIENQTYPKELLKIFVVADNCTDRTAEVAREKGAIVYERFDQKKIGKGYALNFLLGHIKEDYSEQFDGYFVFDADNLLAPDYVAEMNAYFGEREIVTSYRNTKNFGDNWVSAGYGLCFLRESVLLNGVRGKLGSSAVVAGTGFMFSDRLLNELGGWNYFTLTEDTQFSIDVITKGYKIGYCPSAMLYDEQPVSFRQSWRQRTRWAKGYIQILLRYSGKLLKGIFGKNGYSCYDMTMSILPMVFFSIFSFFVNLICGVVALCLHQDVSFLWTGLPQAFLSAYGLFFFYGLVVTISEWKKIKALGWKKILYVFTFPIFMFTFLPIAFVALFKKAEWKPIVHERAVGLQGMDDYARGTKEVKGVKGVKGIKKKVA